MLSDDVKEMGFVLLCCSLPMGDCEVRTVDEEVRALAGRPADGLLPSLPPPATSGASRLPDALGRSLSTLVYMMISAYAES